MLNAPPIDKSVWLETVGGAKSGRVFGAGEPSKSFVESLYSTSSVTSKQNSAPQEPFEAVFQLPASDSAGHPPTMQAPFAMQPPFGMQPPVMPIIGSSTSTQPWQHMYGGSMPSFFSNNMAAHLPASTPSSGGLSSPLVPSCPPPPPPKNSLSVLGNNSNRGYYMILILRNKLEFRSLRGRGMLDKFPFAAHIECVISEETDIPHSSGLPVNDDPEVESYPALVEFDEAKRKPRCKLQIEGAGSEVRAVAVVAPEFNCSASCSYGSNRGDAVDGFKEEVREDRGGVGDRRPFLILVVSSLTRRRRRLRAGAERRGDRAKTTWRGSGSGGG
ncbi:hypothetical protein Tsubulata_050969 [Turnera subulata]|uniref:Uncharacterized protein n=1 Tax=Turnera subulata TaxID=218843 RepID=A0A9Q0FAS8_9ROSI|nr:hypothetical protein Tsubulata_050969 [Turnera subulata]